MMVQKFAIAALVVPLTLAAFAGTAGAQTTGQSNPLSVNCTGGAAQIQPLGAPGSWSCTATVTYTVGPISEPATPAIVVIDAPDAPSWMNVIIAPNALSFPYTQGQPEVVRQFTVSVALKSDAPAFETQKVTINPTVTAQPREPAVVVVPQPTQLSVTPGYFNLYNVRVDQKIGRAGPQDAVTYPIVIDNYSNGQTRFQFSLAAPESVPKGFQPVIPEPFVLESKASGGKTTSGQVSFQVYTPYRNGYVNDVGAIQLVVESFYAPNTNIKGATSQVSTLTQARGFYVPGPEAPIVVLGTLGVALGLAWARRDE